MNKLSVYRRAAVIGALVEGNSVRATCRMTNAAKGTVLRLLAEIGAACWQYHDAHVRDLRSQQIQCDEIWSFVYAKEKNVPESKKGDSGYGDVWTFVAIDADTKLVPCWLVGQRDAGYAFEFIDDLRQRLANRVQITTDGHKMYLQAVEGAFGSEVDYAELVKVYGATPESERRYSPAQCIASQKHPIQGNPDPAHISTSYIERQNLTMRMSMRRFTRLTNAFSKKVANLEYAVALHYMHYNFARPHKALGNMTTPAIAAGLTDHVWTVEEIVALADSN
ncbi:MAG: DDE-type integrase/transposase/recombinase [Chloroflexi bacterium]|nr:DDE-type integrase/transposase/recombinase [Chloroflexota bacterium]